MLSRPTRSLPFCGASTNSTANGQRCRTTCRRVTTSRHWAPCGCHALICHALISYARCTKSRHRSRMRTKRNWRPKTSPKRRCTNSKAHSKAIMTHVGSRDTPFLSAFVSTSTGMLPLKNASSKPERPRAENGCASSITLPTTTMSTRCSKTPCPIRRKMKSKPTSEPRSNACRFARRRNWPSCSFCSRVCMYICSGRLSGIDWASKVPNWISSSGMCSRTSVTSPWKCGNACCTQCAAPSAPPTSCAKWPTMSTPIPSRG
mmetsp:Transcript_99056/g.159722  ORF Transcript_99056/g.159722 Transcript_99056/m.159722 type:complete len:261 (-) Transcript_99056:1164-1946(-)